VESREHENVGVKDGFETIQVEARDDYECLFGEEEVRNHDIKGGEKCLIGDEEVWMKDENLLLSTYCITRKGIPSKGAK